MFNFRELIELWRTDNLLTQALNDSYVMLDSTRDMFRASVRSLRSSDSGEMGFDIYKMDQQVNQYEREVRRKVLKHLAITGGLNIIPGLILTSIVIDVERIGDYTKNIKDLAVVHPKKLMCGKHEADIARLEPAVGALFDEIIPAVKTTDKEKARKIVADNWWILKKCDEILNSLIAGEDSGMTPGDAVATGIYARYLKRIAAHLMNVATSVVNPFESIGFHKDA
jgi:phosphate transport system protein